jgi:hypothetical protein
MNKSEIVIDFDPAIEAIINQQFEKGLCDRQTKINMMIGKLCDLHRQYGKEEANSIEWSENNVVLEKLENEIEKLGDEISKELYKLNAD